MIRWSGQLDIVPGACHTAHSSQLNLWRTIMNTTKCALLSSVTMVAAASLALFTGSAGAQTFAGDDFETVPSSSFPNCPWLDVGLINLERPNPPIPSALVESVVTTRGVHTQALKTIPAIAQTQGAYLLIPVSSVYTVAADVRIDQFSDNSAFETSDWPMQVGVGKLEGDTNLAFTPQVGIYVASRTQGWRFYADGVGEAFADVDLEAVAEIGVWYHVEMEFNAVTGSAHSQITNLVTDTVVVDRTDQIPGWTPQDGVFDRLMLIDGELTPETTIPNIAVVDNVTIETTPANPPGPQGDLDGDGDVDGADLGLLLANWTG
jgi:hypothetical protein